ncbi:MAG TPA: UbiD family decarboxylase [Methylomirabilota bacterium]
MSDDAAYQSLRGFISLLDRSHPGELVRIAEPVDLAYQMQALALELERRRRFPVLIFEQVRGHSIPVVSNVMASRQGLATALGVTEAELPETYAARLKEPVKPVVLGRPPFVVDVRRGDAADLGALPIPTYFPGDGGPYLTAGLLIARDPATGVSTAGFHRFQVKGRNRLGVSLHSRRRMFEFQQREEKAGRSLQCAIAIGLHPVVGMGSLSYPAPEISKFEIVGGLFGEPMQLRRAETMDMDVPAWAEIVIEGEILPGEREPEGPFGEFTGYFSRRSTDNVFVARAMVIREGAWFHSIASGRAPDHILPLGVLREAEIRNALRRVVPGVRAVHVPTSGGASFTAYVSIKQTRPGEAKHAISVVLGVDHYLKLVVIVDDDIDVFDESDVLWAMATRVQADRDLIVIGGSLGAILDPSASSDGLTAKLGIDATRAFGQASAEKLVMSEAPMEWARQVADRISRSK